MSLRDELLTGLRLDSKKISPKFLYDETGSALFEKICDLREYYVTRTETGILRQNLEEITSMIGRDCRLMEYGSGSSTKTRLLLDLLEGEVSYFPVDISQEFLLRSAEELRKLYPKVTIVPISADFTKPFKIPEPLNSPGGNTAVFFPGSTLGNFEPIEALQFLRNTAERFEHGCKLLLGIDLVKDVGRLEAAYNDEQGVTAAFNLNLLRRFNREFEADFDVNLFSHRAFFSQERSRIEMHLVSHEDQKVRLGSEVIRFKRGETVHTESSYKYTPQNFQALAWAAGFVPIKMWTDEQKLFAVYLLNNTVPQET
jgi:dimethylhistidine N-methyltransferase